MEIRQAILAAADQIEAQPHRFAFGFVEIPRVKDKYAGGCALGWIGTFALEKSPWNSYSSVLPALGIGDPSSGRESTFYARMDQINNKWRLDAKVCAKGLRKYADKYHPAVKHTGIPAGVLAIFKEKATAIVAIALAFIGFHH